LLDKLPTGPVNLVSQRGWYIAISALLLIPSIVFIALMMWQQPNHAPVKLGIDFTGGTLVEMGFNKPLTAADGVTIQTVVKEAGYKDAIVQLQQPQAALETSKASADKSGEAKVAADRGLKTIASLRMPHLAEGAMTTIGKGITQKVGTFTLLQKTAIGPTLAGELLTNGILALVAAYVLIVGFLTFRFQFDYAICAIVALLHDTLFVMGVFAGLGYLYGIEVDSLFVTAMLTVVGFSVHDTIVVFDRIRENLRLFYSKKLPFSTLANISINQTLSRSINTSVTALLPMLTLFFFGGQSTHLFTLALVVGITAGTYSSIWVASLLLVWWRERGGQTAS
jgi:preprotein translocase subunit SecF